MVLVTAKVLSAYRTQRKVHVNGSLHSQFAKSINSQLNIKMQTTSNNISTNLNQLNEIEFRLPRRFTRRVSACVCVCAVHIICLHLALQF